MGDPPVTIAVYGTDPEGEKQLALACKRLASEGLWCDVQRRTKGGAHFAARAPPASSREGSPRNVMGQLRSSLGPGSLNVHSSDATRACALLGLKEDDIDPEGGPVCPRCHRQYVSLSTPLWSVLASKLSRGRIALRRRLFCDYCRLLWPAPEGSPPAERGPYR